MKKLELWFPAKPFHLNQGFGSNADYYARFHDSFGNPYKGHNGNDLQAYTGQPVYASIDGVATYVTDPHGGQGVIITTTEPFEYENGSCYFNVLFWHLIGDTDPKFPKPFNLTKTPVKVGDLIGYADNTGAPFESSGTHLHVGLVPVDANEKPLLPGNGYAGCIDPTSYFNSYFAQDSSKVIVLLQTLASLLQKAVSLFKK